MRKWAKIQYREFYDVPRIFVTEYQGHPYLFESKFDADKDDYSDIYSVFRMPEDTLSWLDATADWSGLSKRGTLVSSIPLSDIHFDETRRRCVDFGALSEVLRL